MTERKKMSEQKKSGQDKKVKPKKIESKKMTFEKENLKKQAEKKTEKKVVESKKSVAKVEKSSKKSDNVCPYAKKCGGCDYQGKPYEEQLKEKQDYVHKTLKGICEVLPIIGMENPYHYRNKVHAVFDIVKGGGKPGTQKGTKRKTSGAAPGTIISGVYKAGTHDVVNIDECQIEDAKADAIIRDIRNLLRSFKIKTYDEDSGYGLLRHVLIRRGHYSGEIMVVLVLGSPILPSKNNFVKALRELHPEISTVVINVNDKRTSMVLGDKETTIYGKGFIEDTLCGKVFRISPKSFYQINTVQTEVLYGKAIEAAGLTGSETIIDAYCGIGTIGIIASDKAKEVISVELNKDAVRDAISNAKRNDIQNVQFYNADAGEFMVSLAEQKKKIDVVFMDPPRAGSDEAFLSSVVKLAPKKVVYVSCNPETLARDLKYLKKNGYEVGKCQPVDMFPHTKHVETIVSLSKGEINSKKVKVEISLEDMDLADLGNGATYSQIKEYVKEQTGLTVSSLNIAQVKKKCGIIERENYNKAKSENAKRPKCTLEKEQAIMEAFKHFGVV